MPQIKSMANLKTWLLNRQQVLAGLVLEAEKNYRSYPPHHGGIGPDDDEIAQESKRLGMKWAILDGELAGIKDAIRALDRFAIHNFNEEASYNGTSI